MANNTNNIKIGDKVFWFDAWDCLRDGTVTEFVTANEGAHAGIPYARIKKGGTSTGAKMEDCYLTKEACLEAKTAKDNAETESLAASITDIQSLIRFMLDNNVSGEPEYGDSNARSAAIRRAKELVPGFTYGE